jgi:hypothetical protein
LPACGLITSLLPIVRAGLMCVPPLVAAETDGSVLEGEPRTLPVVGSIPARKTMDAAVFDNLLYFVGANTLWVADLTNPSRPAVVGNARFDGNGRQIAVENDVAYVTARADGLYIFDVSQPETPRLLSHYDTIERATGVDVHGDLLCIAERQYGVELVDVSAPSDPRFLSNVQTDDAQSVAIQGHYAYVLKLWPQVREVSRIETKGHALHVDARENLIYVSEGREGLSVWELASHGHIELRGRFEDPSRHTIRRTLVKGETPYAVAESASRFFVVDISDPSRPRKVIEHKAGIIYGDQISHGLVAGRYVCVSDHVTPMRWLDLAADDPKRIDTGIDLAENFFWMQGAAAVGNQLLATYDGGYRLVPALSTGLEQAPTIRAERSLSGKVRVWGDLLFVIRRNASRVAIVDISQIESPRLLGELETDGNPHAAVVRDNALLIPDGYNGLLIYDGLLATLESED